MMSRKKKPKPDPEMDLIRGLPKDTFINLVKLGLWAAEGVQNHGLELAYVDEELLMFKGWQGKVKNDQGQV